MGCRGVFLALKSWMESSRHSPAVVGRNSISSHRSRQNAFNCSVMAFHFLNPLFANTCRCSNASRLFLTRPCPHLQAENEGYEKRRKTGGCLKRKHQGYIFNCLGQATGSAAKWLGDRCVFTNMADEVMVQGGIFANWIMWGQCINGMNGIWSHVQELNAVVFVCQLKIWLSQHETGQEAWGWNWCECLCVCMCVCVRVCEREKVECVCVCVPACVQV